MPSPSRRSRSLRKVKKRLPGGRLTTHYEKKASSKPRCASCGKRLLGVSSSPTKTKKRPERPYGGVLCFSCLQERMREKARSM